MAPRLDAQAQKDHSIAVLHVDIATWKSPVARHYNLHSIPHLQVYDSNGILLAEGQAAYRYVK
ncbi:hypothetical protein JST97_38540 [bacterium]|nr:hypothetical protein [bacterium]